MEPMEAIQQAIDQSAEIQEALDKAKLSQRSLEEEVTQHVEFVKIRGYERMAEVRMLKPGPGAAALSEDTDERSQQAAANVIQGSIQTYQHLDDEDLQAQLFKDS